ncbi:MAG: glycerol kinase, partial [Clostridia bacterium]|nr:glycerol kinase [Clostridia bacterium]
IETTALGAANLAALAVGVYSSLDEIAAAWAKDRTFCPAMNAETCEDLLSHWHKAVTRSLDWVEHT